MAQERIFQPDYPLSEVCKIALEKLQSVLTGVDPESGKKIATITGRNIVIQGETFTYALSVPRNMDHIPGNQQYYTMHNSEDGGSVASSPLGGMEVVTGQVLQLDQVYSN